MAAFQDALTDCNLIDLDYIGAHFTWSNGRGTGLVRRRLDRAVASSSWKDIFAHHRVFHLSSSHSDHLPIFITEGRQGPGEDFCWGHVPRYDTFWFRDDEFKDVLEAAWLPFRHCNGASELTSAIANVRTNLLNWSKKKFGSIQKKVKKDPKDPQ